MHKLLDAFISYGRADSKAFAIRLRQYLEDQGLVVWLDIDDIPKGVNYQEQIKVSLERARNAIFVMSPHSVNSEHCRQELDLATGFKKRIIPLLYIPEIDQAVWHRNYPRKTIDEWNQYQSENRQFGDSRNPFLHRAIQHINWISFKESNQTFELACSQLLEVLARHSDYVEQHTALLMRALEWQQQRRRSQYLLVGQDLQTARQWLLQRFADQPPCQPTDLHCELIAESTKNANNLMTQVFLAYSETDRETADKVRYSLMRAGITVWSSHWDIESGKDFQQAINEGIEATDNLVFLISPESLQSDYCLKELNYALSLYKRVIPLLSRKVDSAAMPPTLQMLQYINLTDNVVAADYSQDESDLLRVINQDADYHRDHKILLVKALRWERQQHNPSILLRGYNLRSAEAWLKTSQRRTHQPPISVQVEFIKASLQQPPDASLDVFISYSHSDSEFARKLNDALQGQGKKTWFDQESIAAGTPNFEQEIYRGIAMADNFLFVLSPQAIASSYCDREVEYAANLNKRFITVLCQPIAPQTPHPELAKVQWIDFSQANNSFYQGFNQVIRILETDRGHVQHHTQISLQALAWQQKAESPDLLLRGGELETAQDWFTRAQQGNQQPQATALQSSYLQASDQAHRAALHRERRQQRLLKSALGLISAAFIGAVGMSIYAVNQKGRAEKLLQTQIRLLSDQSHALVQNGQELDGLLQATHAGQLLDNAGVVDPKIEKMVANVLQESLAWVRARNRVVAHTQEITKMAISPDGQLIATASLDKTAKLWNRDGKLIHTLDHKNGVNELKFTFDSQYLVTQDRSRTLTVWTRQGDKQREISYEDDIWSMDVSPDGELVAIGSKNGQAQIWRLSDGQPVRSLNHGLLPVGGIRFSPNGDYLVSRDDSGNTFKLWNRDGTLRQSFVHRSVWDVLFSPDGQTLASRGQGGTLKLWSSAGAEINSWTLDADIYEFSFSPDSQLLATATSSGSVQLRQAKDGQLLRSFKYQSGGFTRSAHEGKINSIHFGANGQTLVTASSDNTVKVWNLNGQEIYRFKHQAEVWEAMPSPDGRWLASYDNQLLLHFWDLEHHSAIALKNHTQKASRGHFSPDGRSLATVSQDGQVNIWDRQGHLIDPLQTGSTNLRDLKISSDGRYFLTAGEDGEGGEGGLVELFNQDDILERSFKHKIGVKKVEISPDRSFKHKTGVKKVEISPDRRYLATSQNNDVIQLWSFDGEMLDERPEQYSPTFSPSSQLLATVRAGNGYLWQVSDQVPYLQEKCLFKGPPDLKVIRKVRFNSNGNLFLTANADGTARIWDLNCKQLQELKHGDKDVAVRDIAVSRDGHLTVTVGDNIVKLWSAEGELLNTLTEHTAEVFMVLFNPDEQSFATAANDQTVKIWNRQGDLLNTLWHRDEILEMEYSADGQQLLVMHGQIPTLWNLNSKLFTSASGLPQDRRRNDWHHFAMSGWSFGKTQPALTATLAQSQVDSLMDQACNWLEPYLYKYKKEEGSRDQHLCE